LKNLFSKHLRDDGRGHKSALSVIGILAATIAARPFSIVVSIVAANYLGPHDKGIAALIIVLSMSIASIATLGCGAAVKFFIARRDDSLKDVGWTTLAMGLANGLIASALVVILLANDWLGKSVSELPWLLKASIVCIIPLATIKLILFRALMGDRRFKVVNILELTTSIAYSALMVILVMFAKMGLAGAVIAFLVPQVAVSAVAICALFAIYQPTFAFDWYICRRAYSYGLRDWIGSLSKQVNLSLDSVILGVVAPAAVLGNYTVALTISKSLLFIPLAITPVLLNRVAEQPQDVAFQLAARIHRTLLYMNILMAIAVGLIVFAILPHIMPAYTEVPLILALLLAGPICLTSFSIMACYCSGRGMPGRSSMAHLMGFLFGAIAYPLMIMKYGAVGGAIACSATYAVSMIALICFVGRTNPGQIHKLFVLQPSDIGWFYSQLSVIAGPLRRRKKAIEPVEVGAQ